MNRFARFAALAAAVLAPAAAMAHGPQIQITNENGKITTRELHVEQPYNEALTPEKSVYVMPLLPSATSGGTEWYARPNNATNIATGLPTYVSGPGIAYGHGWTFENGTGTATFPVGSHFMMELTDGLKRWNGSAFIDPGTEQLQAFRVSQNQVVATATSSDSGPSPSFMFDNIAAPTSATGLDAHASVRYRLLGDGSSSTSAAQDGIYLLTMRLTNNNPSVTASDPFQFVLYKNVSEAAVQSVVAAAFPDAGSVQFVPEPSAMAMAALAGAGCCAAADGPDAVGLAGVGGRSRAASAGAGRPRSDVLCNAVRTQSTRPG